MSEPDVRRVVSVLRGRRWLFAVVGAPFLLLAALYALTLPPMYHSSVVMGFSPDVDAPANDAFVRLLPTYAITVTSQPALRAVENELALAPGSLRGAVSSKLVSDSLQLTLTVEGAQPQTVEAVAQSLADNVVRLADDDDAVTARILAAPGEAQNEAGLRRAVALGTGALLAVGAGLMVVLAVEAAAPRVRLADDLLQLGAPVLQQMPGLRRGLHTGKVLVRADMDPRGKHLATLLSALARHAEAGGCAGREPIYFCPVASWRQLRVGVLVERIRLAQAGEGTAHLEVDSCPPLSGLGPHAPSLHRRMYVLVVPGGARVELVRQEVAIGRALGAHLLGFVLVG